MVSEISRESASKGKNLFSFASKYCCYHNNFVYKRDDYSIFDQVVKDNLPSYLAGLVKSDIEKCRVAHDYKTFNDIIGQILDKNNIHIENRRRKFDHYIWYLNRKNFY